jgi:hypothetical protein
VVEVSKDHKSWIIYHGGQLRVVTAREQIYCLVVHEIVLR